MLSLPQTFPTCWDMTAIKLLLSKNRATIWNHVSIRTDRQQLEAFQIRLGEFIYSLPAAERNNYCNIYSFRVRNIRQQYVRVISKHQVMEQDAAGKAWLILGNMDISPNQEETDGVDCTVLNLRNGEMFSPSLPPRRQPILTPRETEILHLIQEGLLSKEIAHKLCISIHTVNIHRQNLLHKLGVQNSIEAINAGLESGLLNRLTASTPPHR